MIADPKGTLLGHFKAPSQMLQVELAVVREFLIKLQKGRKDDMATAAKNSTEICNMVFIAGKLKFDPKEFENMNSCLVDVGTKSAIQVQVSKKGKGNEALSEKLLRFREGDFIRVVATLRPYGVKQENGNWKNGMAIEITEIKTDPPKREHTQKTNPASDDDLPF